MTWVPIVPFGKMTLKAAKFLPRARSVMIGSSIAAAYVGTKPRRMALARLDATKAPGPGSDASIVETAITTDGEEHFGYDKRLNDDDRKALKKDSKGDKNKAGQRVPSIVINGSVNANIGMPNTSVYGASKAALLSLRLTLSGELISRGIRVNAVSPGPIATPLYGKLGLSDADLKAVSASLETKVPAGRFGTAAEIASAIVFLASDESAYMVGSELAIDGGLGTL